MMHRSDLRLGIARRCAVLAVVCGSALAAAPVSAQVSRDPIVVQGERLPEAAAREQAAAFVRSTGVAASETPAARWLDPVCPRVLGLTQEGARSAENVMRAIAIQAGAQVAPEPCDSNIVVIFTANAAALVREIDRREPRRFAELDSTERQALLQGSAPIRWWHTSEVRDMSGGNGGQQRTSQAASVPATQAGSGAGSDLTANVPTMTRYSNSIISTYAQRGLLSATVVVDQNAVMGRRLGAIAAYAALVALAEIRSLESGPPGSILGLFGSQNPPSRLTAQDIGFLRTLYRMPLDRQARYHRGTLVAGMASATSGEASAGN